MAVFLIIVFSANNSFNGQFCNFFGIYEAVPVETQINFKTLETSLVIKLDFFFWNPAKG